MSRPALSVIVPAHDEEHGIGGMLTDLLDGAAEHLEVIVVANGCHDATAATARAAHPGIRVVEVPLASKIAALNAGDQATTVFPRAYVDADVSVSGRALLELAVALDTDLPRVATAALELDLSGATLPVRLYYRVWMLRAEGRSDRLGSGVYGVNSAGRERFGEFPDVVADDRFVQGRFAPGERLVPAGCTSVVRPPRTIPALLHRGARIAAGNLQLAAAGLGGEAPPSGSSLGVFLRAVLADPSLWPGFALYCWVHVRTRRLARRKLATEPVLGWARDETTRT